MSDQHTNPTQPDAQPPSGQPEPASPVEVQPEPVAEPEGKLPTLADVQGQACPNCSVGVLHVVTYDPEARHQLGENAGTFADRGVNGSYSVRCLNCDFGASYALASSDKEGR
jgi:hypothetical protein